MPSSNLSRNTSGTGTSNQKFTMSLWIKKSSTDSAVRRLIELYNSSAYYVSFRFRDDSSNRLDFYSESNGVGVNLRTNRSFRDLSAWYHIVLSVDTTLTTADDRMKMYVNGVQETSFALRTNPSLNENLNFNNSGNGQYIARAVGTETDRMFDGSMAHVHFIDGTAYDASAFGETDATTGIWKPKTAPSVTYGTNGFFLKFENSGSLGTDSSGNANNFTVNGTPTQTVDTPSNVFATMNPLDGGINGTFSNGNLQLATSSAGYSTTRATLGFSAGKWYWEGKLSSGTAANIGINTSSTDIAYTNQFLGYPSTGYAYSTSGNKANNNTNTAYGASYTTNDIIGVAFDADSGTLTFYKNGVSQGTAFTGLTEDTYHPAISDDSGGSACTWQMNFGNGYFGTTAVSTPTTDESGLGIFEYDVPTGYYALCTKNINTQEYA